MADRAPAPGDPRRSPASTSHRAAATHRSRGWLGVMLLSLAGALLLAVVGRSWLIPACEGGGCPSVEQLGSYRPPEPPQVLDRDGNPVGRLSGPRRTVVPLDSIPPLIRDGYVAVEDRRYWEHQGVDLKSVARALVENLAAGGVEEGASTITMQLARNVYAEEVLDYNRWHRKLTEIRLAREIEDQLGKEEILDLYLNQIYLGDGVYGVESAARHYFGKSVGKVNATEAALLIGLAKNPEGFNPRRNPERARERIGVVLDILVREGVLDPEEAEEARERELELAEPESGDWGENAYYLNAVRREIRQLLPDPMDRRGIRVHTGLDARAQMAAVAALRDQISAIEGGQWGPFRHPTPDGTLEPTQGAPSPYLQGMVVAMAAATGLVSSLVGGRDYVHSEFDRAFQARRQPGSAFKPIVYLAAVGQGLRLSQLVSTEPVRLVQTGSEDWEPQDHLAGEPLSVREALARSSNSATVRVGQHVGIAEVVGQARELGISTPIPEVPAVFLGAGEVVPAELVAAYAAFGNGGRRIEPHFITHVVDWRGRVVYRRGPEAGNQVADPAAAFLVLDVMRDVVRTGTGWRVGASGLSAPVAGKTGTTNESRDLWFIGMTPSLAAGVWLGFDQPATVVAGAGGGDLAAPAWAHFMEVASRGEGAGGGWRVPPDVVEVEIDAATGYRGTPRCPASEARIEYFISGTEPRPACPEDGWELLADEDQERFWRLPWEQGGDSSERRDGSWFRDRDVVGDSLRRERERWLDSAEDAWGRRRSWVDTIRPGGNRNEEERPRRERDRNPPADSGGAAEPPRTDTIRPRGREPDGAPPPPRVPRTDTLRPRRPPPETAGRPGNQAT